MIISVNWLRKYTDITLPIDELATLIGSRLVEVEEVIDLGARYKGIVVAEVKTAEKHPEADKLHIVWIDDGGVTADVPRREDGLVQVVCGAPNVRAGLKVAWIPPGATLPSTCTDPQPIVLEARKLRGVMSHGMLASPKELEIGESHEGILEVEGGSPAGTPIATVYELDDYLLDIENKSLTHRPDCFGVIGFAREVAAIQGKAFTSPDWLTILGVASSADNDTITATIDDPALCDRYQALALRGIDATKPSPLWLQSYLARVGMRPISAVVDLTNYLMLESGQPLHAFDYDKLAAQNNGMIDIHVRAGREGETLALLDGRTITLTPEDIVIANGETAVALAGAMGGAATEVDDATTAIVLESATFSLYKLRATQMHHGIFSEAITRFTKGQPARLTAPVLAEAMSRMSGACGGYPSSAVAEACPVKPEWIRIEVSVAKVNEVLGTALSVEDIVTALAATEFSAEIGEASNNSTLQIIAPYWRTDIHIDEDIIEEVGRLRGYDTISPTMPSRDFRPVRASGFDDFSARLRQLLARVGANEVLTYSFVDGDMIQKAGQDIAQSYRIVNSISPRLQYYRQSLTPSLLQLVHPNSKQGFDHFALFELNKVHPRQLGLGDDGVPREASAVACVVASKRPSHGVAYYESRRLFDAVAGKLGLQLAYAPLAVADAAAAAPFESRRSALVSDVRTGAVLGIVGEYTKAVTKAFKLPAHTAGFEFDTQALYDAVRDLAPSYTPLSRFPGTERDVCFKIAGDVTYAAIVDELHRSLASEACETQILPVDVYQAEAETTKNVTVRVSLVSHQKTLTADEATAIMARASQAVVAATGAVVV